MRLSDLIASLIEQMISDDADGMAEIRRNELASRLGCVPSQINYVITSRFTPEQGYIVESRRGGGGYIRIRRVEVSGNEMMSRVMDSIGPRLNEESARMYLSTLLSSGIIDEQAARLMHAATCGQALREIPQVLRDPLRAAIFKQMLITQIDGNK